jgi:hypothetical protein
LTQQESPNRLKERKEEGSYAKDVQHTGIGRRLDKHLISR